MTWGRRERAGTRTDLWVPSMGRGQDLVVPLTPSAVGVSQYTASVSLATGTLAVGDLILIMGNWRKTLATTLTLSTNGPSVTTIFNPGSQSVGVALGYAVATSTDSVTATATIGANASNSRIVIHVIVIRGAAATPVDGAETGSGTAAGAVTVPSFTPVESRAFAVFGVGSNQSVTPTAPAGWSSSACYNIDSGSILCWRRLASTETATGNAAVGGIAGGSSYYARTAIRRAS